LTAYLERELRANFGEAWITGYESLIQRMTNDEKDRHVVAAAVHGEAAIIVTSTFATSGQSIWRRGVSARCTLNSS
jgi:hypothetical protein